MQSKQLYWNHIAFVLPVNLLHIFGTPFLKTTTGGLLCVQLIRKVNWKKIFSWCAFNNFAWLKLRWWLLLKNFAEITLHVFCTKTWSCETLYQQKLYHIKLSLFIVKIVNNLPAGLYLKICLYFNLYLPLVHIIAHHCIENDFITCG